MSPGGYGGVDASLGKRFSEAIAAHSRDNQLPPEELSEAWWSKGGEQHEATQKEFEFRNMKRSPMRSIYIYICNIKHIK